MSHPLKNVISVQAAAEIIGVSSKRVNALVAAGRLPSAKPARDVLLWRADVEAFSRIERPDGVKLTQPDQ